MINAIPILGWIISFLVSCSLAIPFWIVWNSLAPVYFYWLPNVYQNIPFWHCVGLFILMPLLKHMVVPKIASVSTTQNNKD
jgi:hypothetical protein